MIRFSKLAAWFLLAAGATGVFAAPLPQASWLVSVGTTWHRGDGDDWAYLMYQASDATAFSGRLIAVYRKDGEPGSPGVFSRQAVTGLQDNPAVIAPLLQRSMNVGEDLNELDDHVTGLFQSLVPAPAVSLPEKLAAVVQGLNADPSLHSRVILLSRRHPGAALAFGMAWAEPLPVGIGAFTYELREFDPATSTDRSVLARMTVRAGAPLVLPAPGIAVNVPTNSPTADLAARLRWATPDPLRRLNPAQMGFNVYRMASNRVVALGFDKKPPEAGVLATMAAQGTDAERVNRQPVVPPKEFTEAGAGNLVLDPVTVFVTDNRGRFTGGSGFHDGETFCYFVAARDVLGRDGQYSPSACVTVCERVQPSAPHHVKVANDYLVEGGAGVQRMSVSWEPSPDAGKQRVARYAIYRWDDRNQLHESVDKMMPIAFVPHVTGTNRFKFIDRGPGAPSVLQDAGKVFWYTVRSVKDTACGPLVSPDSAPVRGIPRDRVGPSGAAPQLTLREPVPSLTSVAIAKEGGGGNLADNTYRYVVRAVRTNREIAWVEIDFLDKSLPTGRSTLGRHYFPPVQAPSYNSHATATDFGSMEWNYVSTNRGGGITNKVRFGLANGVASREFTVIARPPPSAGYSGGVQVNLAVDWQSVAADGSHASHTPRDLVPELRANGGRVQGVPMAFPLPADARQWRVYRRLGDGPLAMVAEGESAAGHAARRAGPAAGAPVQYTDDSMPANVTDARYYTQYLDGDGNAGPMLSSQVIKISTPPPAPSLLSLIAGDGGTNDPATTMSLTWSGAPYGLARYRIWIGNPERLNLATLIPMSLGTTGTGGPAGRAARPARLAPAIATTRPFLAAVYRDFVVDGVITNLPCTLVDTTLVGGRVGVGPVYSNLLQRATISADLYVQIEPVAEDGTVGPPSLSSVLRAGSGTVATNKAVPWPRRPLPPSHTNFTTGADGFAAVRIKNGNANGDHDADFDGIGVAVGYVHINAKGGSSVPLGRNGWLNTTEDPDDVLFKDVATSRPIFGQVLVTGTRVTPPGLELPSFLILQPAVSAVLYRQQQPGTEFPQPAGDLIQVTPRMTGLDHKLVQPGPAVVAPVDLPASQITDPFVGIFPYGTGHGLFLLDTQPVVSGASYQYFLVRFDEFGEMIEVLPTNIVTVTP